ncbi:CopG family transcriptional regulator [Caballeronia sp. dw_19]|uniref:CopG family transcriptional regulator n=1 Tax=Caballeronia sp. dw_19 TaxID=2719791 RepID=UPI001BD5715D|nr:CopG family transcriptional regulator [Caballeronia sp. dw_19]
MTIAMKSVDVQAAINLADEVKRRANELEREAIREGLEDVDAGRTVTMDAMDQWLDSLDTSSELPTPKAETSRASI